MHDDTDVSDEPQALLLFLAAGCVASASFCPAAETLSAIAFPKTATA